MKTLIGIAFFLTVLLVFSNCNPARKSASNTPAITYETHVQNIVTTRCTPCHIPSKGGKKKDYTTFTAVQGDIDEILRRIQLNPGEKGFMPFKGNKLGADTIEIFQQWKNKGTIEK